MSTATTGRPVGDNEFPVLLRLPDLNAPTWAPLPTAVAAPEPVAVVAPVNAAPISSITALPPTSITEITPVSASTTVEVVTPAPRVETATATTLPRAERQARADRSSSPHQWSLLRQLATGGVLVGGLALTYLFVMGGAPEELPSHIPVADSTLEPPVIEQPAMSGPTTQGPEVVVVRPEPRDTVPDIADSTDPPHFDSNWKTEPPIQSHIEVADNTRRDVRKPETPREQPQHPSVEERSPALNPPTPPADNSRFMGRVGPSPDLSSNGLAPRYPTTDPKTYLYRPQTSESSDAIRTAELEGTIAPAPRR